MSSTSETVALSRAVRAVESTLDLSMLALKPVDRTSRFFSRKLILFPETDASTTHEQTKVRYSFALLVRFCTEWEPNGYGVGDLVHSISLMPNEELTLEVRTWETDKLTAEQGSTTEAQRTSDVTAKQSYSSEVMDDVTLKMAASVDAAGEVSYPTASGSLNVGLDTAYEDSSKSAVRQTREMARHSVNEMKTARTVKMTVSRESGHEDKTTRKIRNINQTRTLTLNHYQVLQAYTVVTKLADVALVVLGQEFTPEKAVDFVVARPASLANRYQSPTVAQMVNSFLTYNLRAERGPHLFRNLMLQYVTPEPNLSTTPLPPTAAAEGKEPKPAFRYVFRVHPGREKELLSHFAGHAPPRVLDGLAEQIVNTISEAQAQVGQPLDESWETTVPTHGIYSEALLGMMSGAEDFIEINRQYDLELKKLEIRKLELEVARLELLNTRLEKGDPASELVVTNAGGASLTMNVNANGTATGETRQITIATQ